MRGLGPQGPAPPHHQIESILPFWISNMTSRYTSTMDMERVSIFSSTLSLKLQKETVKNILDAASIRHPKDSPVLEVYTTFIGTFLSNLVASVKFSNKLAFSVDNTFTRLPEYETPEWKKLTHYKRHKIMNAMKSLGFVVQYSRGQSLAKHDRACLSLYQAGPNLLSAFDLDPIYNGCLKNQHSTIVRDVNDVEHSIITPETSILNHYNQYWMKRVNFLAEPMTMIFKHDTNLNGRVYSSYQNMSQEGRSTIMIDKEPTAEVDFSSSHMNILSLWKNKTTVADAYSRILKNVTVEGVSRDDVKTAIMRYTNSTNPSSNLQYCEKWTKEKTHEVINAIEKTFPFMKSIKGKQFGLVSMKVEGMISIKMIQWALMNNEVILPVHDSFICRESIKDQVEQTMNRIRQEVVGEFNFDEAMKSLDGYKSVKKEAIKAGKVKMTEEDKAELMDQVEVKFNEIQVTFKKAVVEATMNPKAHKGMTINQYAMQWVPVKVEEAIVGLKELWNEEGGDDDPWMFLKNQDMNMVKRGKYPVWFA